MKVTAIVAADLNLCIGKNNTIPWRQKNDMLHFKSVTSGAVVIMGRKTYESIGKPLPDRKTVVLTRSEDFAVHHPDVIVAHTESEALAAAKDFLKKAARDEVFVVGGSQIYTAFSEYVTTWILTLVKTYVNGDAFLQKSMFADALVCVTARESPSKDNEHACVYVTVHKNYPRYAITEEAKSFYVPFIPWLTNQQVDEQAKQKHNHILSLLDACKKTESAAQHKVSDVEFSFFPGNQSNICAIRSTEFFPLSRGNWRDTVRNLLVFPWYDQRIGWCHFGYLQAAKKAVKEAMKKEECVTAFTGFSMGGAVALLAAELYKYETSSEYHTGTIVFGAPNPTYTKPHKTWVNYRLKNDIVGSWPPLGSKKARKNIGVGNLSGSYNDLKGRFKTHNLQQYINYFKIGE